MSNHNLDSAFRKLIRESYLTYRGYRGERTSVGIFCGGKVFSESEFCDYIDNYIKSGKEAIRNSIKK